MSGFHLDKKKLITELEALSKDNEQLLLKLNDTEKQLCISRSVYEHLKMQVLSKEDRISAQIINY